MSTWRDDLLILRAVYSAVALPIREVWLRYVALGGRADEISVDAQIHGVLDLSAGEFNVLAHALNEEADELPEAASLPRVPYKQAFAEEDREGR